MKNLFFLFLPFYLTSAFAQNGEAKLSNQNFENASSTAINEIIKLNDNYYVFSKSPIKGPGGWNYFLDVLDADLKLLNRQDFSNELKGTGGYKQTSECIKVGENLALFNSKKPSDENPNHSLIMHKIDPSNGSIKEKIELISYSGKLELNFSFDVSNNGEYLLITTQYLSNVKADPARGVSASKRIDKIDYTVLNKDFEETWSEENFIIDSDDKPYAYKATRLGNNGKIYVYGIVQTERSQYEIRNKIPPNPENGVWQSHISVIGKDESHYQIIPVLENNMTKFEEQLIITENGDLLLAGYSRDDDGETYYYTATYFVKLNAQNGAFEEEISKRFDADFLNLGWTETPKEKKKREKKPKTDLGDITFIKSCALKNNSVSLVSVRKDYNQAKGNYYRDYIICTLSSSGEIEFSKIKKEVNKFDMVIANIDKITLFTSSTRSEIAEIEDPSKNNKNTVIAQYYTNKPPIEILDLNNSFEGKTSPESSIKIGVKRYFQKFYIEENDATEVFMKILVPGNKYELLRISL